MPPIGKSETITPAGGDVHPPRIDLRAPQLTLGGRIIAPLIEDGVQKPAHTDPKPP